MKASPGKLRGLLVLEPRVFTDDRGFFVESYNRDVMAEIGITDEFVQDNHSFSRRGVVRGLHYQVQRSQGKLIRVIAGEILDVALDLRRSSPTFGQWEAVRLSGENRRIFWMPPGFAHGFRVISDAHVAYKATDFYFPNFERTIAWNDPDLKIDWEIKGKAIVSEKDRAGARFRDAEVYS
jgi:dTDP-4-dehydrorhamnose 3,5-epimerase